jgi:predicted phosphodiesterase
MGCAGMKLQLLSDLHLEVDPHFVPQAAPGADLLILAGDIGARPNAPLSRHGRNDWCLSRFSPKLGNWPVPVVYLPGNHEFDGQDFDECYGALREQAESLGMVWLEKETRVLGDVRLLGTTLWTDFDALCQWPESAPGIMTHRLQMRQKASHAADFYLRKVGTTRHGQPFDAAGVRDEALVCQNWLRAQLEQPFGGKTVVVTHFAPSLKSADPRYGVTPGTAGFCNALDPLVAQADVWLHGHLHCPSRYTVQRCRVFANPLGYAKSGEQVGFESQLLIQP